jgi:hypothetical protein
MLMQRAAAGANLQILEFSCTQKAMLNMMNIALRIASENRRFLQ